MIFDSYSCLCSLSIFGKLVCLEKLYLSSHKSCAIDYIWYNYYIGRVKKVG